MNMKAKDHFVDTSLKNLKAIEFTLTTEINKLRNLISELESKPNHTKASTCTTSILEAQPKTRTRNGEYSFNFWLEEVLKAYKSYKSYATVKDIQEYMLESKKLKLPHSTAHKVVDMLLRSENLVCLTPGERRNIKYVAPEYRNQVFTKDEVVRFIQSHHKDIHIFKLRKMLCASRNLTGTPYSSLLSIKLSLEEAIKDGWPKIKRTKNGYYAPVGFFTSQHKDKSKSAKLHTPNSTLVFTKDEVVDVVLKENKELYIHTIRGKLCASRNLDGVPQESVNSIRSALTEAIKDKKIKRTKRGFYAPIDYVESNFDSAPTNIVRLIEEQAKSTHIGFDPASGKDKTIMSEVTSEGIRMTEIKDEPTKKKSVGKTTTVVVEKPLLTKNFSLKEMLFKRFG